MPRSSSSSGSTALLGCDDVPGELEQCLEELDADAAALLVPLPQLLEPLAELLEARVVPTCLRRRRDDLDLDLLGLLVRIGRPEHRLEQVGVEDERLEVVADRVDVDVLVDELDRLGAEHVPEQLARAARRLDRLVDLGRASGSRSRTG